MNYKFKILLVIMMIMSKKFFICVFHDVHQCIDDANGSMIILLCVLKI
jgi:hypothetical protein